MQSPVFGFSRRWGIFVLRLGDMIVGPRYFWLPCLLGAILVAISADIAVAGWMGFRNDTSDAIVVQETITVNGQPKPGRPQRLTAGEAIRDNQCIGGQRHFSIYDPKNPDQPVFTGNLACPNLNENLLYLIKSSARGITLELLKTSVQQTPPKK